MHQHAGGDIVGMIILNLEVIDLDGAFKQLVLDFFNNEVVSRFMRKFDSGIWQKSITGGGASAPPWLL